MYITQGLHRSVQISGNMLSTQFGDRRRTWNETADRVGRLAAGLASLGVATGDRVGILAVNSDRYLEAYYAVAWSGAVIVPGNIRWSEAEHHFAFRDAGVKVLLVDRLFSSLLPAFEDLKFDAVIYMDDGEPPAGAIGYEELIAAFDPAPDQCTRDDDLVGIFYTGGTTGFPKGVMLSHRSIISSFLCSAALTYRGEAPVFLHSAPMFHLADASCVFGVTMTGGSHVILPLFSTAGVIDAVTRLGANSLVLVPTMFSMIDQHLREEPADLSGVTHITYGASPISESLLRRAIEIFPNAQFSQAYGQTELSPVATVLEPRFHALTGPDSGRLRSAGRAAPGIDVRIIDADLNELPRGQVGEIAVQSPGCMVGYWNQPELTAQTIVDGWLRTGDAGYMDGEGFVFVVDRVKDMIISGGENVFSAEVENALSSHSAVLECAVIGVPDGHWGERVHAIVVLRDGMSASGEELRAHCQGLIAGYKCPRSFDFSNEPLPLSGTGKVLKTELRKLYWDGLERSVS
ncbi:long-chain-fatty-acid--CoA ligase [Novosphingobium aquae]|uniref:Long-chain-fatty-acid--CoA ligase n=1 Tax=Novosphingobium aquae TaxID=3133435 RepID=A0ABU8SBE3_9SPHN